LDLREVNEEKAENRKFKSKIMEDLPPGAWKIIE